MLIKFVKKTFVKIIKKETFNRKAILTVILINIDKISRYACRSVKSSDNIFLQIEHKKKKRKKWESIN